MHNIRLSWSFRISVVSKKTVLQLCVTTAIVAVVVGIYASSGSIEWDELRVSLAAFGWQGYLLSLLFLCGQMIFMIFRYWALIPDEHAPGLVRISYAISVGQAVNNYFPARAGDFVKAALLTRNPKAALYRNTPVGETDRRFTFLKAMGLIVADRIVDVGTLILMVVVCALFMPLDVIPRDELPSKQTVWLALASFLVAAFIARHLLAKTVNDKLRKLREWFREFRGGFAGMLTPRKLLLGIFFAALSWCGEILSIQMLSGMQGFPMTFAEAVFVLLILNFFISVPLSIANFGPFEWGVVMALQAVEKIPKEQALAVATVHHIAQMAAVTLIAFLSFLLVRLIKPPR